MSDSATLKTFKQDGVTVLVLGGEYESYGHESFEHFTGVILDIVQTAEPPLLVVDLSQITFFGSALLGVLFRGWNRLMARQGGRFAICGLSSHSADVFEATQLDRLWQIYESREEALRTLSGS